MNTLFIQFILLLLLTSSMALADPTTDHSVLPELLPEQIFDVDGAPLSEGSSYLIFSNENAGLGVAEKPYTCPLHVAERPMHVTNPIARPLVVNFHVLVSVDIGPVQKVLHPEYMGTIIEGDEIALEFKGNPYLGCMGSSLVWQVSEDSTVQTGGSSDAVQVFSGSKFQIVKAGLPTDRYASGPSHPSVFYKFQHCPLGDDILCSDVGTQYDPITGAPLLVVNGEHKKPLYVAFKKV